MQDELRCPKCGSQNVSYDQEQEYTGGGYGDVWYNYYCEHCGHEWRSETESDYM